MSGNPLKCTASATVHPENPSVARQKLIEPLTTVPNILDDATHGLLNGKVMWASDEDPTTLSPLRTLIVEFSDGTLDSQYRDTDPAMNLLIAHPELKQLIREAWKKRDFTDIRNLAILRPPRLETTPARGISREQEKATENSWERGFVGGAAEVLWNHIVKHYTLKDSDFYAHYTAIVPSSGMGKSRVVDELEKHHFSIPINLRGPEPTGYPPADTMSETS